MSERAYNMKSALPNKVLDGDGNITDLFGNAVTPSSEAYKNKPSLPNKWLNPDGTYSTLTEIIAGAIDTDVFVIVDELPEEGNPKKIYLVPDGEGGFIEYHYTDGNWDPIGTVEIDLSQYSTTDEMNAAILAALNQAKAYADILFGNIVPDVYALTKAPSGTSNSWSADAIAELQAIRDTNGDKPCIIIHKSGYVYFSTTHKIGGSGLIFWAIQPPFYDPQNTVYGYGTIRSKRLTVNINVDNTGTITSVSSTYLNGGIGCFIDPTVTYTTPFSPTNPGHPATKKYVDDAIANSVTSALGGEY